jgi:hypothetical protein
VKALAADDWLVAAVFALAGESFLQVFGWP